MAIKIDDDVIAIAKKIGRQREGYRQFPYRDNSAAKFLTIGIGRNLDTVGISTEEAEFLQSNDIKKSCELLAKNLPWFVDMTSARQAVFVDMVFNIGNKFFDFKKMLDHAKNGRYADAAREMIDSLWCKQVGERALHAAQIFESGVYAQYVKSR